MCKAVTEMQRRYVIFISESDFQIKSVRERYHMTDGSWIKTRRGGSAALMDHKRSDDLAHI